MKPIVGHASTQAGQGSIVLLALSDSYVALTYDCVEVIENLGDFGTKSCDLVVIL